MAAPGECAAGADSERARVAADYAKTAARPGDTSTGVAVKSSLMGYTPEELEWVGGADGGLGCGTPVRLAELRAGEVVVDVGCGKGIDTLLAARQVGAGGRVTGVDMTPEMVAAARGLAAGRAAGGSVTYVVGEAERLPIGDASADVVISNGVLNLSPEKQRCFAEAFRVLRPGGRFCWSDVMSTAPLPDRFRDTAFVSCWVAGAHDPEGLRQRLGAAGFVDVRITLHPESREYIKLWVPGSGVEEYICAGDITAVKPVAASL